MLLSLVSRQMLDLSPISARCPGCSQRGTFESAAEGVLDLWGQDASRSAPLVLGQRICPNDDCRTHIFFVKQSRELLVTYPAQRLDFDETDVPVKVKVSLDEAISCHANRCFRAAGMMVRKTLEEVCAEREAKGPNLQERIKALRGRVILPEELFDGLDEIRLLGNDAAHVESRQYDNVGKEEVEIAIEFTKEFLKAVYQYGTLLGDLEIWRSGDRRSGDRRWRSEIGDRGQPPNSCLRPLDPPSVETWLEVDLQARFSGRVCPSTSRWRIAGGCLPRKPRPRRSRRSRRSGDQEIRRSGDQEIGDQEIGDSPRTPILASRRCPIRLRSRSRRLVAQGAAGTALQFSNERGVSKR